MIYRIGNVLPLGDCQQLIKKFDGNPLTYKFKELQTYIWDITAEPSLQNTIKHIEQQVQVNISDAEMERAEIVKWPVGTECPMHYDVSRPNIYAASILYLNDDYEGGLSVFEDVIQIQPSRGNMIVFDGAAIRHGVSKITNGTRYVMPIWYKKGQLC